MPLRSRPPSPEALARVLAVLGAPARAPSGWVPATEPGATAIGSSGPGGAGEDRVTQSSADPPSALAAPAAPVPRSSVGGLSAVEPAPERLIGAQPFVPGRPQQVVEPVPEPVGVGSVLARLRAGRVDPGRRGALALASVAVLAAVVAGVVLLRSRPVEQPLAAPAVAASAASRAGGSGVASAPQSPSAAVVVSVAGKVRRPGLVHLLAGSRVDDAVRAAGGVLPGSGPGLLNLARKLVDGEQVLVGVAAPPAAPGPASEGSAASGAPGSALDLNAATASDFDTLPGIGPVLADHLVTWRTQHGGRFASVDQLRQVSGIGESKYQQLKDKVRV